MQVESMNHRFPCVNVLDHTGTNAAPLLQSRNTPRALQRSYVSSAPKQDEWWGFQADLKKRIKADMATNALHPSRQQKQPLRGDTRMCTCALDLL